MFRIRPNIGAVKVAVGLWGEEGEKKKSMNIQEQRRLKSPNHLLHAVALAVKRGPLRGVFSARGISMPLKREILSTNKGHPRTLWNVIYMHRPGVRGQRMLWRGQSGSTRYRCSFHWTTMRCTGQGASLHITATATDRDGEREKKATRGDDMAAIRIIGCSACAFRYSPRL